MAIEDITGQVLRNIIVRAPEPDARGEFNPHLHGARGLFAIAVFAFHVANSGLPTWDWTRGYLIYRFFMSLQFGVELFFGISGVVILGTLVRSPSATAFLRNRAIRIMPVLWVTVTVVTVLSVITDSQTAGSVRLAALAWIIPANLVALPGILPLPLIHPPAWSLSYELAFYLVVAVTWWRMRYHPRGALAFGTVFAIAICLIRPRAIFFASGLLLASGLAEQPWIMKAARWPMLAFAVFLASWSAVELRGGIPIIDQTILAWFETLQLPLAALAWIAATIGLAGIIRGHGALGRLLATRPALWLGTISYSLYLWHPIVLAITKRGMRSLGLVEAAGPAAQLLLMLLALPATLVIAVWSQKLLEDRLSRALKKRSFATKSGSTKLGSPAAP